jgi:parallel beta-helix repeat protein
LVAILRTALPGLAATYYVNNQHPQADDANPGTLEAPLKTIQAGADKAQAGDTVIVKAGTYRESIAWRNPGKPDARSLLAAADGETVVVKGSSVIKGWEKCSAKDAGMVEDYPGANIWVKNNWVRKEILMPTEQKLPGFYIQFDDIRQAFYKDAVLEGAGRLWAAFFKHEFEEGRIFHDKDGKRLFIWLAPGIDPNKEGIEVSVRAGLFGGTYTDRNRKVESLDYVTVRGIQFRHAARGHGITTMDGEQAAVEDCISTWNYDSGIYVRGNKSRIVRNIFGYNGNAGLTGCKDGHLFEDNLVIGNNLDNHVYFNNSGGGKLVHLTNCVFRRHKAVYNNGCGLWLDIECNDNVFEDCVFSHNAGVGLDIEISRRNLVRNCIFAFNGPRPSGFAISHTGKQANQRTYDAGGGGWGLTSRNSDGTHVYHCLFYGNAEGGLLLGGGQRAWVEKDPKTGQEVKHEVGGRDLVAMNNIIANNGRWQLNMASPSKDPDAKGHKSDYNLFWGPNPVNGFGNIEQWTKDSSFDEHSLYERPDVPFGLDGNFELPSTSAAVDAGILVEQCKVDRRGVARPVGKGVDIGPFERAGTLGVGHRPQAPKDLKFETIDLSAHTKMDWKDQPDTGMVALTAWPAGAKDKHLGAFAESLPKGADGKPAAGIVKLTEIPFALGYPETGFALPSTRQGWVEIPVNRKLDWLFFLHAGTGGGKGTPAAYYRIYFSDDDSMNISMTCEQNFTGYLSAKPEEFFARERGATSAVAWRGKTPDNKDAVIHRMAWPNHRPDVTVTRIQVWRQNGGCEWLLMGITAGNAPDRPFAPEPPKPAAPTTQPNKSK